MKAKLSRKLRSKKAFSNRFQTTVIASEAKARSSFRPFMARIEPCPFKTVEHMDAFLGLKPRAPSVNHNMQLSLRQPARPSR
jgi:hypothetical protein